MKVFLTGASGFLGQAVLQRLRKANLEVLALSRSDSTDKIINAANATPIRGNLENIDENHLYPKTPNSYYGKAKKEAEEFLLKNKFNMEIIILRPTFIWGNGANAFATIAAKVKTGQFLWIDNGNANFEAVHVDNVAESVFLALTKGKNGEVYFITDDEPSTVKEFFSETFKALNLPIPAKSLATFIASPAACLIETAWRLTNISSPPPLTRFDLSFVNMPRRYNINKAKRELGYQPILSRDQGFSKIVSILQREKNSNL